MKQRSSSSSKARSLLRAPSRSLARGNSPRKRRGMDLYTEPDPLLITSSESYAQSTLRHTIPSSDFMKDEISSSSSPTTSTAQNSHLNSPHCVIHGTNDTPQDFVATGTVLYFPEKQSYLRIASNLHPAQTHQEGFPSPNSKTIEDDNLPFTVMKARRVNFISTTARRFQIKDTRPEVECKNTELNSSRGSKFENKTSGESWTERIKKRTHNLVGKNDISKDEHTSVDEEWMRDSRKILKKSKGFETFHEPQAIDDPLAQLKIAITQPKLISLEEAQRNDERRKEEYSKSRCSASRAFTRPKDRDEIFHQEPVSLDELESERKPMEDDFDRRKTGALKYCNELIALSEAENHRKQEAQSELTDAGVPTITKRHASGFVPCHLDPTDEITEMYTLKRRRSNIQSNAYTQEFPHRKKTNYFDNQGE
ncbi:hypothetical protein DFH28DRAFT_1083488 [Melampsora americana]|nr:hypothetical protein DFH28DRAFT_1083488 [Melampsora americana]